MGKKKRGEWSWGEPSEVQKEVENLREDIRRKVKEEDDKLNYDTGSK